MTELETAYQRIAALEAELAAMRAVGEPVAYLWQHGETGRTRVLMPDAVFTDDGRWGLVGPLYTHPQPAVQLEEGFILVAVKGFYDLAYWLDRCANKGYLENCSDLIEPWENFEYRAIAAQGEKP